MDLWEDAFEGVESIDYTHVLADMESFFQCNISKITENAFVYIMVRILTTETFGSHFGGTCTCGVPKHDGIPCEHMVMMAKAGVIKECWFMRLSIMPYWLSTKRWHLQFPQTIVSLDEMSDVIDLANSPRTTVGFQDPIDSSAGPGTLQNSNEPPCANCGGTICQNATHHDTPFWLMFLS